MPYFQSLGKGGGEDFGLAGGRLSPGMHKP
jgi:hypothetical protein